MNRVILKNGKLLLFNELVKLVPASSFISNEHIEHCNYFANKKYETLSDDFKHLSCDNICLKNLNVPTVIELGHIKSDNIRQIFVHFLMKKFKDVYVYQGKSHYPRAALILEESEKILPSYKDITGMTVVDRLLSEMRKFGLSVIVVSQAPSETHPGVMRNTGVKLIHRITSPKDLRELRYLIESKDQLDGISRMKEGEVLVASSSRADKARVVPLDEWLTDPEKLLNYKRESLYVLSDC